MTDPIDRTALLAEFKALRRNYGIRSTHLRKRIGPLLRDLCDIPPNADDPKIREKIVSTIDSISGKLTAVDLRVVEIALGSQRPPLLQLLGVRTEQIQHEFNWSERTARRRIDRAFDVLVDELLAARNANTRSTPESESGWRVTKFKALLRLDTPTPHVTETREIEATRDGLRMIVARMSLPKRETSARAGTDLFADLEYGARMISRERTEGYFKYLLELPKELNHSDRHEYAITYRIPPDQPIRTHYAFVPMVTCEEFEVRVRFAPDNLPAVVWRIDRLPPVVMANHLTPGLPLELDGACEAELTFRNMEQGFGYGLAWLPSDDPGQ
jgi:hypothetical protein